MPAQRNPWSAENWNLTEQGRIVRTQGVAAAEAMAEAAGTTLTGPRPLSLGQYAAVPRSNFTVIVQQKGVRGGGSIANAPQGYAGDGPPDPNF